MPETRYARAGDVHIAYQNIGNGPVDLILVPGWISNVDVFWDEPTVVRFFNQLSAFSRLILFDKRGTGLSDRLGGIPSLEERMDDIRAVMDAVGSEKAALFGYSEGGPLCALFAGTYPERTHSLILFGSYARRKWAPDYPQGISEEASDAMEDAIRQSWGVSGMDITRRIPSRSNDRRFVQWWSRFLRAGASPSSALDLQRMNSQIDARPILPSIRVPTLIMHAAHDQVVTVEAGRYLAENIAGAKFVEMDVLDHVPFGDGAPQVLDEIAQFLTGHGDVVADDRVVATIVFTDIVDSTRLATEMGDAAWRDMIAAHNQAIRRELLVHRGTEVKTTGDGFLATFDGPARAIRCAQAARAALTQLGLEIRVGIHTGECVRRNDDVEGLAVHIAARIAALAGGGEVLVSQTVKDLVAGSGIDFEARGARELKGVPGPWQLFAPMP